MDDRVLLQQALDALDTARPACFADNTLEAIDNAIAALRERLAQPEQEPVAWMSEHRFDELRKGFTVMTTLTKQIAFEDDVALYTTPPAQPAPVPLTDEQIEHLWETRVSQPCPRYPLEKADWVQFARAIEAKLKEKNT